MSSIRLVTGSAASVETDLLVIPAFDGERIGDAIPDLDAATGGETGRATASGEFRGRFADFFVTPARHAG